MIKHAWIIKRDDYTYICNQACSTTKEKLAENQTDVTCKNCLKIIDRYPFGLEIN